MYNTDLIKKYIFIWLLNLCKVEYYWLLLFSLKPNLDVEHIYGSPDICLKSAKVNIHITIPGRIVKFQALGHSEWRAHQVQLSKDFSTRARKLAVVSTVAMETRRTAVSLFLLGPISVFQGFRFISDQRRVFQYEDGSHLPRRQRGDRHHHARRWRWRWCWKRRMVGEPAEA